MNGSMTKSFVIGDLVWYKDTTWYITGFFGNNVSLRKGKNEITVAKCNVELVMTPLVENELYGFKRNQVVLHNNKVYEIVEIWSNHTTTLRSLDKKSWLTASIRDIKSYKEYVEGFHGEGANPEKEPKVEDADEIDTDVLDEESLPICARDLVLYETDRKVYTVWATSSNTILCSMTYPRDSKRIWLQNHEVKRIGRSSTGTIVGLDDLVYYLGMTWIVTKVLGKQLSLDGILSSFWSVADVDEVTKLGYADADYFILKRKKQLGTPSNFLSTHKESEQPFQRDFVDAKLEKLGKL